MENSDHGKFCEMLFIVAKQYGKDLDSATYAAYFGALKLYTLEEIAVGIKLAAAARPDYFPTAPRIEKTIREQIKSSRRTGSEVASEIIAAIEHGYGKSQGSNRYYLTVDVAAFTNRPDSLRDEALKKCPPPNESKSLPYWRNHFCEVYEHCSETSHDLPLIDRDVLNLLTARGMS